MVRLYRIGEISHNQKMEEQKAGNGKEKVVVDNVEQLKSIVTTNEMVARVKKCKEEHFIFFLKKYKNTSLCMRY